MIQYKMIYLFNNDYPNYLISNIGEVINKTTGKILKQSKDKDGYPRVHIINKDGKNKCIRVHRLVAETFIPNPENKTQVDHINAIRDDNRVENLRWTTRKENSNNPITLNNLIKSHLKHTYIHQYNTGNILLRVWSTIKEITDNIEGLHKANICAAINGKTKSAGGYIWTNKPLNYNDYNLFVIFPNTIPLSSIFNSS